jgi:hypothetical protein
MGRILLSPEGEEELRIASEAEKADTQKTPTKLDGDVKNQQHLASEKTFAEQDIAMGPILVKVDSYRDDK